MSEPNSGTLPEPFELTYSELDSVAGGARGFVRQSNRAHVAIGNDNVITTDTGGVSIGAGNTIIISQSNTNSGSVSISD
jgi:hypothetical protein